MKRTIQITADGSETIAIEEMKVTYHSRHGAVQESQHVFIDAGMRHVLPHLKAEPLALFEMGFGTGLNALLSLQEAEKLQQPVLYFAVEQFPLDQQEWRQLGYGKLLQLPTEFEAMHCAEWETKVPITKSFDLYKSKSSLLTIEPPQQYHLIYYDAFAPSAQPELWTEDVFREMYSILYPGGVLVTYCSKGDVRRAMTAAGFAIEKIPGPPGKREMIRATKR